MTTKDSSVVVVGVCSHWREVLQKTSQKSRLSKTPEPRRPCSGERNSLRRSQRRPRSRNVAAAHLSLRGHRPTRLLLRPRRRRPPRPPELPLGAVRALHPGAPAAVAGHLPCAFALFFPAPVAGASEQGQGEGELVFLAGGGWCWFAAVLHESRDP